MALKLMYITNNPDIACIAEAAGVDRIFVDMEYIGKSIRQGGMDTVQSHHTIADIKKIRRVISKAQVMVRINPIHKASAEYGSSKEEIDAVIEAGADLIMLPYFTSVREIEDFIMLVDGRVKTFPLLESAKAVEVIDDILKVPGIDEIHIGLNDLSLDLKKKFMFELLTDGTVENLCCKLKRKGIPYGFGGIGRLGKGELPAENIVREHYRLVSTCAILSRSFCNANNVSDLNEIKKIFIEGVQEIRKLERECETYASYFKENEEIIIRKVQAIVEKK